MAFESLTERLQNVFKNLRKKGKISEADVQEATKEIRLALLEADVALPVVKDFIKRVRERAVGHEVKQMNYIELYYADDYSLAEIAEEFGVSRQAVYDNIKRTEKILEDYEMKLHMYSDYIVRSQIFDQISDKYPDDAYLQEQIAVLSSIDNRE